MASKLRKAIGAVKDQTSISLAKVSASSNLDVAILRATTHDEYPVEDRYINEIVLLTSSNKMYAAACAHALSKRIGRTHNWIVALKGLMIVLRIFQDGDPYFPREVLITMRRGRKILNLHNFRDDYNSSPWDYTAFVRTIALYLNQRLDCFITGKLQRRMEMRGKDRFYYQPHAQRLNEHVHDMKPAVLVDRIQNWQDLLDRAIGTRPTGVAKNNRLVQVSLYGIVRETFDLYRDISDGLSLLLDSFFHLPVQICLTAFNACARSSQQFEQLSDFYALCKEMGVGRSSEYPSVQTISEALLETLDEFLKDRKQFSDIAQQTSAQLRLPPPLHRKGSSRSKSSSSRHAYSEQFERNLVGGRSTAAGLEPRERRRGMLLEDLISATEPGAATPSYSLEKDNDRIIVRLPSSSSIEDFQSMDTPGTSPTLSSVDKERNSEDPAKPSSVDDLASLHTAGTSPAMSRNSSLIDLMSESNPVQTQTYSKAADQSSMSSGHDHKGSEEQSLLDDLLSLDTTTAAAPISDNPQPSAMGHHRAPSRDEWERVLAETANSIPSHTHEASTSRDQSNCNNPFIALGDEFSIVPFSGANAFSSGPTFQVAPTFRAGSPNEYIGNDLVNFQTSQATLNQPHVLREQQLWFQNQNEIMARHM